MASPSGDIEGVLVRLGRDDRAHRVDARGTVGSGRRQVPEPDTNVIEQRRSFGCHLRLTVSELWPGDHTATNRGKLKLLRQPARGTCDREAPISTSLADEPSEWDHHDVRLTARILAAAAATAAAVAVLAMVWPFSHPGVSGTAFAPHYSGFGWYTYSPLPANPSLDDLRHAGVSVPQDEVYRRRTEAEIAAAVAATALSSAWFLRRRTAE